MNLAFAKAAVAFGLAPLWSDRARAAVGATLDRWPTRRVIAAFAGLQAAIFLALNLTGLVKVPGSPSDWALIVQGKLPSPYFPGFDLILSTLLHTFGSPLAFVVAMNLAAILAFAVFAAWIVPAGGPALRPLLAFWFVNPITLFHVTLGGEDEALILLIWCVVAAFVVAGRARVGAGAGGLVLPWSKFLAIFGFIPLLALPRRRLSWASAVLVVVVGAEAIVLLTSGASLSGFTQEARYLTSGNVWTLPNFVWDLKGAALLEFAVMAAAVAGAALYVMARPVSGGVDQILRLTGTVGCTFLLLSPKSVSAWMVAFLPGILFLILSTTGRLRTALLALFLPVSIFEQSLWFYFDEGVTIRASSWGVPVMIALDIVLVAAYAALAWRGLRLHLSCTSPSLIDPSIRTTPQPASC